MPRSSSPARVRRPLQDLGGVGTEEARAVNYRTIDHRIVLAKMMALYTIAPRAAVRRSAENREVIFFRVSALTAVILD